MARKNHGVIGYRQSSATMFVNMDGIIKTSELGEMQSTIPPDRMPTMPWSPWGTNNLLPQQLTQDISATGILNSIIDGKARFALCQGMVPAIVETNDEGQRVIKKYINDPEIKAFLDDNNAFFQAFGWMKDQIGFAQGVARFLLNKGRDKIVAFQRHDVTEMRLQKKDPATGKIANAFFSADWACVRGKGDKKNLITIPLLDENNPLADLISRKNQSNEFCLVFRYPGWGTHYYSMPMWYAAYKWVKIAQGVPEMKAALYANTMVLRYMVVINEGFWAKRFGDDWDDYTEEKQEEKRNAFYDEVNDFLVGAKNAHKSIFVNGYRDPITGNTWQDVEIKPIEGETVGDAYLPDSAAANSEIAFALLFNPAIIGASMPSGPYSNSQGGSNVRESVLLQIILHELERNHIQRVMGLIARFNGWVDKYPGLEFVIPATVLTTLDTGGSTKPVAMGTGATDKNNSQPANTK